MNWKFVAGLALVAALVPATLAAQSASERRAGESAPPSGEKSSIKWEKDLDKAKARATKEDKRVLALFFSAGGG